MKQFIAIITAAFAMTAFAAEPAKKEEPKPAASTPAKKDEKKPTKSEPAKPATPEATPKAETPKK